MVLILVVILSYSFRVIIDVFEHKIINYLFYSLLGIFILFIIRYISLNFVQSLLSTCFATDMLTTVRDQLNRGFDHVLNGYHTFGNIFCVSSEFNNLLA